LVITKIRYTDVARQCSPHIAGTSGNLLNTWLWEILLTFLLQSWFGTIRLPPVSQNEESPAKSKFPNWQNSSKCTSSNA